MQSRALDDKARKRRPRGSGAYPTTPIRLPPELVAALDKYATKIQSNRSAVMRQFLEAGLKRAKG
jgi:predicted DNA-binding protein